MIYSQKNSGFFNQPKAAIDILVFKDFKDLFSGDFEKALEHYTNSIQLNPGSAILHAKRAKYEEWIR